MSNVTICKLKCVLLRTLVLALIAPVVWANLAYGQVIGGRLMGTVIDSSGGAVPGAQVTITS